MTERQLFSAIGEVDETMVAAAAPFKQKKPFYGWMLAAAAAVVVGVIGYAALMEWQQQTPPAIDPAPTPSTTTAPVTEDLPPLVYDRFWNNEGGVRGTDTFVTAFSFEELQIQSLTEVPTTLPVYTVQFENYDEAHEQEAIIRRYAALTGDTLTEPINVFDSYGVSSDVNGEKFRYMMEGRSEEGGRNFIQLQLKQPVTLDPSQDALAQMIAVCPALFSHMKQPTLFSYDGSRAWQRNTENDRYEVYYDEVHFKRSVYDAANEIDAASRWLSGIDVYIYEGKIMSFLVKLSENCEKLADYPVLTLDEACAEVYRLYPPGQYTALVNEKYEVKSVELVYYSNSASTLRVPLYRFLLTANETYFGKNLYDQAGALVFQEVMIPAISEAYWVKEDKNVPGVGADSTTANAVSGNKTTSTAALSAG